jgi:hypothetical protein
VRLHDHVIYLRIIRNKLTLFAPRRHARNDHVHFDTRFYEGLPRAQQRDPMFSRNRAVETVGRLLGMQVLVFQEFDSVLNSYLLSYEKRGRSIELSDSFTKLVNVVSDLLHVIAENLYDKEKIIFIDLLKRKTTKITDHFVFTR